MTENDRSRVRRRYKMRFYVIASFTLNIPKIEQYQLVTSLQSCFPVEDAYGTFPLSGKMEGSTYSLGNYYSCLEVKSKEENINGRYCNILHVPIPLSILSELTPPSEAQDGDSRYSPFLPNDDDSPVINLIKRYLYDVSYIITFYFFILYKIRFFECAKKSRPRTLLLLFSSSVKRKEIIGHFDNTKN